MSEEKFLNEVKRILNDAPESAAKSAAPQDAAPQHEPLNQTHKPAVRCKCGHAKDHYLVEEHCRYGFWGWLRLVIGINTRPLEVTYKCSRCNEVLESTTAPDDLEKYW